MNMEHPTTYVERQKNENMEQLGIPYNQRQIALVRFYRPAKQNNK